MRGQQAKTARGGLTAISLSCETTVFDASSRTVLTFTSLSSQFKFRTSENVSGCTRIGSHSILFTSKNGQVRETQPSSLVKQPLSQKTFSCGLLTVAVSGSNFMEWKKTTKNMNR